MTEPCTQDSGRYQLRSVEITGPVAMIEPMPCVRLRFTRRLLAALLLLCFGIYGVESEVADVHDIQAEREQVTTGHGPVRNGPSEIPSGSDSHPVHVCHCSHTHVGVLGTTPTLNVVMVPSPPSEWPSPVIALSTRLLPPLRPPIV